MLWPMCVDFVLMACLCRFRRVALAACMVSLVGTLATSAVAAGLPPMVEANDADALALSAVKGIGPALAARLVVARRAGRFKDWANLVARVQGLGRERAQALSDAGLCVNGLAWQGVQAQPHVKKRDRAPQQAARHPRRQAKRAPAS